MRRTDSHKAWLAALAGVVIALPGCLGGDSGGVFDPLKAAPTFLAQDLTTNAYYSVPVEKAAEGTHCVVYVESGAPVSPATADAIAAEFDNVIHPAATAAFGSEPNPGVDGDPKITILLLDIRDGYNPAAGGGFVSGYFQPGNEYPKSVNPNSNVREMFYMDVNPGEPGSHQFFRTLAHEFQHMIHWEQKDRLRLNLQRSDDTWLNEAMSEAAPALCGYGPDYLRVLGFEFAPFNSLTRWGNGLADYSVVSMWSAYVNDTFGSGIFRDILHNSQTGIDSVNAGLVAAGTGKDFAGVFRDWSIAVFSGSSIFWPGHPEWSYSSLDTWPGFHTMADNVTVFIPGLFFDNNWMNRTTLFHLDAWSVDYYFYTPLAGTAGSVAWDNVAASDKATFIDWGTGTLTFDMLPGVSHPYTDTGFLILQNPSATDNTGGESVTFLSAGRAAGATLKEYLDAAGRDPLARARIRRGGSPEPLCIHPFLVDGESEFREKLKAKGKKLAF